MISNFYIKLFKIEKICDASTITSCFLIYAVNYSTRKSYVIKVGLTIYKLSSINITNSVEDKEVAQNFSSLLVLSQSRINVLYLWRNQDET